MKKIILLILIFTFHLAKADDSIGRWTKNYNNLVSVLKRTKKVGDCGLYLAMELNRPKNAWMVNFITAQGPVLFEINPPRATNGQTQVDTLSNNVIIYRQSDIAGWVNMVVHLNKN